MRLAEAAAPAFRPVVVLWMIVVGVVSFGAFFVLLAYAPDLRDGGDGRAHALSTSAVGYAGAVRLLEARGVAVDRGGRADESGLLIVTPETFGDAEALGEMDRVGPMLVVLPKWRTEPDAARPAWVRKAGVEPVGAVGALLRTVAPGARLGRAADAPAPLTVRGVSSPYTGQRHAAGAVESLQTLAGPGLFPLLVDDRSRMLLAQVGEAGDGEETYVLSDPDLLNNQGLKSLGRARLADVMLAGLRRGESPLVFDVTLNGFERGRSLLKLAMEPPFLAATLCALAAALLTGLHAAARFGPPRVPERAVALGKRALADNAAGLIRLAKREPRMAPRYAQLVREQTARAVGVPRDLGPEQQAAFLDRLATRAGAGASLTILADAAAAVRDPAALMRSAQALHRWRTEMTRGR